MKNRIILSLFATLSLLAASPSLVAAPKTTDTRVGALVAALQAVSPDPLGGRLGLDVAAARTPGPEMSSPNSNRTVQNSGVTADQRAYQIWKKTQKS
jgi:hypothetical protein